MYRIFRHYIPKTLLRLGKAQQQQRLRNVVPENSVHGIPSLAL
jgi:hypothetical protein